MRSLSIARPLNASLVVRRPTPAELAHRRPLTLTHRDQAILTITHVFGFLTTDLIELAYFPPDHPHRAAPSTCAYDRLRQLWLWGYLERVELPQARSVGGRLPYLYSLGRQGVPIIQEQVSEPVHARRIDRLDALFVDHNLKAAALWANLHRLGCDQPVRQIARVSAWGERQLRAWRLASLTTYPHRRRWPFLPDGMLKLQYRDGRTQLIAVEIDAGTLTTTRFRRKIECFERYVSVGGIRQTFGAEHLDVWILAPTATRLQHLLKVIGQVVSTGRRDAYFLTTFATLDPPRFRRPGAGLWIGGDQTRYDDPLFMPVSPHSKARTLPLASPQAHA